MICTKLIFNYAHKLSKKPTTLYCRALVKINSNVIWLEIEKTEIQINYCGLKTGSAIRLKCESSVVNIIYNGYETY